MTARELPEHKIIICKDFRFKGVKAFFDEVEEAILAGWTVWDNPTPRLAHSMGQVPMVALVRKEVDEGSTPDEDDHAAMLGDTKTVNTFTAVDPVIKIDPPTDEPETSLVEDALVELGEMTKSAEMRGFADKYEITIPEGVKLPTVIKKYLKGQLEAKQT